MKKIFILFILCFIVAEKGNAQIILPYSDTTVILGSSLNLSVSYEGGLHDVLSLADEFSDKIDIGFPFTYFGNTYEQCVISENNFISFDTSLANKHSQYVYSNAVNFGELNHAILFPFQDVYYPGGGEISYITTGITPNRKFIVTFCRTPLYFYDTIKTTNQLIINEGSNTIEMYITSKPNTCTMMDNGTAIQGLKNNNIEVYVPGRNVAQVPWTVTNDAKLFTPAGSNNYTISSPTFKPWRIIDSLTTSDLRWYDQNNTLLGTGLTQTVIPTANTHYYTIRYNGPTGGCDTSVYTFVDTVHVTVHDTTTVTGINIIKNIDKNINVYPNPTRNNIIIESKNDCRIESLVVFNPLGRKVQTEVFKTFNSKNTVLLQGVTSGIYYLEITTDKGIVRKKIEVINP